MSGAERYLTEALMAAGLVVEVVTLLTERGETPDVLRSLNA